ncbi:hypothetical protein WJX73_003864 [Symbiochloris irregularis]|uniref:Bidirectional sugar transporter SWEET n=1 Tax=Symbiochloris irregularis TaxID=706552 RepID=A0AAW1NX81_9CHLO
MSRSSIPVREVLAARKARRLGELNPSPFAAMLLNHTAWVVYSLVHTDFFIFTMEAYGLLCGIWLTLSLFPLAAISVQNRLNGFVLLAASLFCCLALTTMILNMLTLDHASTLVWSWACSATQVVMCASPLTTLYKAVQQRSCASFHLGLIIMSTLSSAMWTVYGLAIKSLFIAIPNLLGGLLSLTALLLCLVFPRRPPADQTIAEEQQERARGLERSVQIP